jgi:methionine aminopeptidase
MKGAHLKRRLQESVSIRQLTAKEAALMRDASQRAATALQYVRVAWSHSIVVAHHRVQAGSLVRPGITTDEIDRRVHEFILG